MEGRVQKEDAGRLEIHAALKGKHTINSISDGRHHRNFSMAIKWALRQSKLHLKASFKIWGVQLGWLKNHRAVVYHTHEESKDIAVLKGREKKNLLQCKAREESRSGEFKFREY